MSGKKIFPYYDSCFNANKISWTSLNADDRKKMCLAMIINKNKLKKQDIAKVWILLLFLLWTLNLLHSNEHFSTNRDLLTKICHKWLAHIFLHNLVSFLNVFTQFTFTFPCENKLALKNYTLHLLVGDKLMLNVTNLLWLIKRAIFV